MNVQPSTAEYVSNKATPTGDTSKVSLNETNMTSKRRNEDRPVLATLYFLLYSFLYTANFVSAAYLYRNNPGLGSF